MINVPMEKNKQNLNNNAFLIANDQKKLYIIKFLGIISLILILFCIVLFIIFLAIPTSYNTDDSNNFLFTKTIGLLIILVLVLFAVSVVLSITTSIFILANKWHSKNLVEGKILWGLLGLLLLGPIASIVFSSVKI